MKTYFHYLAYKIKKSWKEDHENLLIPIAERVNYIYVELKCGNYRNMAERISGLLDDLKLDGYTDMLALRETFKEYDKLRVQQVQEGFIKLNDFLNQTYFGGYKK